jgi:hypothetical protein
MKHSLYCNCIVLIILILSFSICNTGCKKTENPIKFPNGTFPDSIYNLSGINSAFDDYNLSPYQLGGSLQLIFSSNRRSNGNQFDLEQSNISFIFDQTNGQFSYSATLTTDAFLDKLINKAKTPGNDFGPYRFYSSLDGYEYLLLSSTTGAGDLDLFYLKNVPISTSTLPEVQGPFPIKLLNGSSDDAYFCFNSNLDSAYFTSNRGGDFDIYLQKRPIEKDMSSWFNLSYVPSAKADSVNSPGDDKCPMIYKNIMVFTSNRPDGFGGFDLYYSIFRNGKWSSPVNFGPEINSSSDEYRPVIGTMPDFTNQYIMFSSNRPGGKGGFDLYLTGYKFPTR